MNTSDTITYAAILEVVHSWAPSMRLALLQDVLRTLQPEPGTTRPRRSTLQEALGMLATGQPAPSDTDIAQWLDEHRLQKYG